MNLFVFTRRNIFVLGFVLLQTAFAAPTSDSYDGSTKTVGRKADGLKRL